MGLIAAFALLCAAIGYQRSRTAKARQASLRTRCANNLKQIGVSIHTYLNRSACFPVGTLPNPSLPVRRRLGWACRSTSSTRRAARMPADRPVEGVG